MVENEPDDKILLSTAEDGSRELQDHHGDEHGEADAEIEAIEKVLSAFDPVVPEGPAAAIPLAGVDRDPRLQEVAQLLGAHDHRASGRA